MMLWLRACPSADQGVIRPMMTASGRVVLFCDEVGEVWLDPSEVAGVSSRFPWGPTWHVVDDVHITPGTTRWADLDDLPEEWLGYAWHAVESGEDVVTPDPSGAEGT